MYNRILEEMSDREMKHACECAYQKALNKGIRDVFINDKFALSEFITIEDRPFREEVICFIGDGMEMTCDHVELPGLIVPETENTDFINMPSHTFEQFLEKSDASYYESDVPGKEGYRRNIRWMDYSARDHEYGRVYVVVGMTFFARLVKELVSLAHQPDFWHKELALRWWNRRNYNIQRRLDILVKQNFHEPETIEFPEMISAEEAMASHRDRRGNPAEEVNRGFKHLRSKCSYRAVKS